MSSIKTSPVGNLYSGIPGAIFNAIKAPLFQIEFGTGGNKIGKGEALLAIIGKNAFKGEKGDIRITTPEGEVEIEVKASNGDTKPSGAVLVALGKGTDAEGKRSKESAYGANTEAGKIFKKLILILILWIFTRLNIPVLDRRLKINIDLNTCLLNKVTNLS